MTWLNDEYLFSSLCSTLAIMPFFVLVSFLLLLRIAASAYAMITRSTASYTRPYGVLLDATFDKAEGMVYFSQPAKVVLHW